MNIGTILVRFGADIGDFIGGLSIVEAAMGGFGATAVAVTGILAGVAIALGVVAVTAAGNFQQSLTKLYTTAGELQSNLQMVGAGIVSMAAQVGTGAQQLVQAMYFVESGGFHGAAGLDVLRIAAMGAKAENANLNDVAKVLVFTLNAYAGTGLTASAAMNILIASTSRGVMTLQELSASVANVLPVAARFGISLIDVGAAMATMTAQGDPAAEAATHLRQMILALEAPSRIGAAALRSVGLTTEQVAAEMRVSLPGALQMIIDAVGKKFPVGSAAYNAAIRDIAGGTRQMMAFLELTGTHLKTFQANVDAITLAVQRGGSSIMGWDAVQGNFNFKIAQAQAALGALAIIVGTALLPALSQIVGMMLPVIAGFTAWVVSSHVVEIALHLVVAALATLISAGAGFAAFLQHNAAAMALFQAVLITLAGVIAGALVAALYSAAAAAAVLVAEFIVLNWPILLVIAAVTLLVAGFLYFYNTSAAFRGIVAAIIAVFREWWAVILQVAAVIGAMMGPALARLQAILAQVGAYVLSIFLPVWLQLVATWNSSLLPSLRQLWAAIVPLLPILQALGAVLGALALVVLAVVVVALGFLVATLAGVAGALAGFLTGLVIVVSGVVQLFTGLVQVLSGIFQLLTDLIRGDFSKLSADLGLIWQGIINIFQGALITIVGLFITVFGTIVGLVSAFVSALIGYFTTLWQALVGGSIIPDMCNAIVAAFTGMIANVLGLVTGFIAGLIAQFNSLSAQAIAAIAAMASSLISQMQAMVSAGIGAAQSLVSGVAGALGQLAGIAANAGAAMIAALVGQINAGVGWVASAINNVVAAIGNVLPHSPAKEGPLSHLNEFGPALTGGFAKGIMRGLPEVRAAVAMMVSPIQGQIAGPVSAAPLALAQGTRASTAAEASTRPIIIQINGRDLIRALGPAMASELRIQMGGRS